MEDYGKFYTYVGRHIKTIRNTWKKKVETFSDRTDLFTYNISEKTKEIHA